MQMLTIEELNTMVTQIEATKLSLVARDESRDYFEARKKRFIIEHRGKWKEIGNEFREERESYGLTQELVAKALGVSASKVSNFENGRSITHAKLMESAYSMFLKIHEVKLIAKGIH